MALFQIDGNGYPWQHGSYQVKTPRLGSSKPTATGGHSRTDKGAWKKSFSITIVCENKNPDTEETVVGGGKILRDQLRASYNEAGPIDIVTPDGDTHSVYFDGDLIEDFRFDVDTEGNGYEYIVKVSFIEE